MSKEWCILVVFPAQSVPVSPQLWSWLQDFLHEGLDPGGVDGARRLTWRRSWWDHMAE